MRILSSVLLSFVSVFFSLAAAPSYGGLAVASIAAAGGAVWLARTSVKHRPTLFRYIVLSLTIIVSLDTILNWAARFLRF